MSNTHFWANFCYIRNPKLDAYVAMLYLIRMCKLIWVLQSFQMDEIEMLQGELDIDNRWRQRLRREEI